MFKIPPFFSFCRSSNRKHQKNKEPDLRRSNNSFQLRAPRRHLPPDTPPVLPSPLRLATRSRPGRRRVVQAGISFHLVLYHGIRLGLLKSTLSDLWTGTSRRPDRRTTRSRPLTGRDGPTTGPTRGSGRGGDGCLYRRRRRTRRTRTTTRTTTRTGTSDRRGPRPRGRTVPNGRKWSWPWRCAAPLTTTRTTTTPVGHGGGGGGGGDRTTSTTTRRNRNRTAK